MLTFLLLLLTVFTVNIDQEIEGLSELCSKINCVNGNCESGACKCSPCYTGPICELMDNAAPSFSESSYHVTILQKPSIGQILTKVIAEDKNKNNCKEQQCPCSRIIYSILDDRNNGIFGINSNTGEIMIMKDGLTMNYEYSITVKVTNEKPFDNTYDTSTVFLNFGKIDTDESEKLGRFRRATAPTAINFTLIQTYPTTFLNTTPVGQKLSFQLTITFPVGVSNLTLQLFAPEASKPVMMLCNVVVASMGSDLSVRSYPTPLYESVTGTVWPYTRATYTILYQSHSQPAPPDISTIQSVITFDTYMLYYNDTPDSTLYYVSVGAEYLSSTQIWVGQSGYYSLMAISTLAPNINLVGDTAVYPGSTAAFDLNIYAPDAYIQLNIGFYTAINDTTLLSFCTVNRYYIGASYSCFPVNYELPVLANTTINLKTYYPSATMNAGYLTNTLRINNPPAGTDKDTFKFKLTLRTNPLSWPGIYTYIGVAVSTTSSAITSLKLTLPVLTKPPKTPYTGTITPVLGFYNGATSSPIGAVTIFLLNITIPQNTELDYTILASFQNLNTEICGFKFLSTGANIPCLNQIDLNPTFTASIDKFQVMSSLTILNIRSVPVSTLPADDVISILISFRPIDDSRNTPGNSILSNITVSWNGGSSSMLSNTFTLLDVPTFPNITNSDLPSFSFQMIRSDGNISVGDSRTMSFTMVLVPGVVYPSASLEFYMPFNVTAQMKICQVKIAYVGLNVLCFSKAAISSNFAYSSKINDTLNYDKLIIPIGCLGSSGQYGTPGSVADSITIYMDILVLTHLLNVENTQTSINAGMKLTSTQIWVGTQNIKFINPPGLPSLTGASTPVIYGSRIDSASNSILNNDIAIIQYIIKIAGSTTAIISLKITSDITTPDSFGVCNITVLQKGNAIPCFQTTPTTVLWSPTSSFIKEYNLQFTKILNSGTLPISNPSFDDNSILLEVIVKFGATIPAAFNIMAVLTYNSGTAPLNLPMVFQSALSRFNGTLTANEPVFTFSLMSLLNGSTPNFAVIGYGEALRAIVSVQLKPASIQSLSIGFSSRPATINQMDIASVNIMSVGKNIPCLKPGMYINIKTSRTSSLSWDMTTLDLGTICRRDTITNSTAVDNTIVIEAVFRLWRIPVGSPTSVDINAMGFVNNDEIYITKITINSAATTDQITETYGPNANITFTPTLSSSTISIGKNVTLNVSIWFPPYTQVKSGAIRVYPIWPNGADSALVVSDDTNFTAIFGSNVLFNRKENLAMSSQSSQNTSQKDNIAANLGVTQNPGTTYRMGKNNYSGPSNDDIIVVAFNIRLTDNIAATAASTFTLIIGAEFGIMRYNQSLTITVARTNTETISILTNTTLITNNTFYTQSNEIVVSVKANLLNTSTLECRNFSIHVATPSFINLTSIKNSSYTSSGYTIQQTSFNLGGFAFTVPYFFLYEELSLTFGITLAPNTTLTRQRQQSLAVIPIIYACKTLNWPSNPLGNKFINNFTDIKFQIQGQPIVIQASGCHNNLKVTDNTVITDCSISSYYAPYVGFEAIKVRNNSGSMWKPFTRGSSYNKYRYIDIVFGTLTTVTNILITSTLTNQPSEISIYGTMDGRSYNFYTTTPLQFTGIVASVILSNPSFNYLGIRISITKTLLNDLETGMNVDLFGCATVNVTNPPTIDPCLPSYTKPVTTLTDFYRRGFLYVAPNLFVCDDIPVSSTYLETSPRCWKVLDSAPTVWLDMGPYVGKVIGYDLTKTTIYAIAADLKSYVISLDNGLTWISINEGGWKAAKIISNLRPATEIPWTTDVLFNPTLNGTSCTKYVSGSWNFCYDGVYNAGIKQLSWDNCCSS